MEKHKLKTGKGLELNKEIKIKQNIPKRYLMKLRKVFYMIDKEEQGCKPSTQSSPILTLLDITINDLGEAVFGFMDQSHIETRFSKFAAKDGKMTFERFIKMIVTDEYHIEQEAIDEVKKMSFFEFSNA